MKRLFIGLLGALMLGGLLGCSANKENSTIGHTTPSLEPSESEAKPVKPEASENIPDKTPEPTPTPDPTPEVVARVCSLAEAKSLALGIKESFSDELLVRITGKVICYFAVSDSYHLMVLTDGGEILPIVVNANATTLGKYRVGNSYTVEGSCGSYRNQPCVRVINDPTREDDNSVGYESLAMAGTISNAYDLAYKLKAKENNCNIDTSI